MNITIAGLVIAVDLPSPAWVQVLRERYAAFLADAVAPAWQVTLVYDPGLADTDAAWIRHEGPLTTFRMATFAGWVDLAARRAAVSTPSAEHAAAALERTLTYILIQALPREYAGLLLHASGMVVNGQGYLFTGPSGAGKTTVARLAAGYAELLCDENMVVREGALPPPPHVAGGYVCPRSASPNHGRAGPHARKRRRGSRLRWLFGSTRRGGTGLDVVEHAVLGCQHAAGVDPPREPQRAPGCDLHAGPYARLPAHPPDAGRGSDGLAGH